MAATNTRLHRPKTSRGKKHVAEREPSIVEPTKKCVFIRGKSCPAQLTSILQDISKLKHSILPFMKHNGLKPFDDHTTLDHIMKVGNFSLFLYGCSSKKNPYLLTLGRYFNESVLDMLEFKVVNYKSIHEVALQTNKTNLLCDIPFGSNCVLSFYNFDSENNEISRIKNLFIDLFHSGRNEVVVVSNISYMIHFTCVSIKDLTFNIKVFKMTLNGNLKQNIPPSVNLTELGPILDIKVVNTHFAEYELLKDAMKQPKSLILHKPKNIKNIERDDSGGMVGKIHIEKQDLSKIKTKRVKALKRSSVNKSLVDRKTASINN